MLRDVVAWRRRRIRPWRCGCTLPRGRGALLRVGGRVWQRQHARGLVYGAVTRHLRLALHSGSAVERGDCIPPHVAWGCFGCAWRGRQFHDLQFHCLRRCCALSRAHEPAHLREEEPPCRRGQRPCNDKATHVAIAVWQRCLSHDARQRESVRRPPCVLRASRPRPYRAKRRRRRR